MKNPEIVNKIRRLRFENNELTQEALAEKVGVTRQTIIALEANKYVPSLSLAFKLARAFNVKIEDVFQDAGRAPETEAGPVSEHEK